MARWFTPVATLLGSLFLLANPAAAQPVTGHASSDAVFDNAFIGTVGEGRIGDGASTSDYEVGLGQDVLAPLVTDQFDWVSGEPVEWSLSYEPGIFGGVITFDIGAVSTAMFTVTAFNSFFVRASAELANTSVVVSGLTLGPPPSGGGGGDLIFETASPTTPAGATATGNGSMLDILKISNVDLEAGFTLSGLATLVFDQASPQPTGSELSFQVYGVDAEALANDADADGTEDELDNCPTDFNDDQADADTDGLGDICDNCAFAVNPPGPDGTQADGDGDGAGDACDNCPVGCTLVLPTTGTCANRDQADADSDGVGDRCDNCRFVPNGPAEAGIPGVGNQLNTRPEPPGTPPQGDACEDTIVNADVSADVTLGAPLTTINAAGGVTTRIDISIDCGQAVAFANIGLNLTGSPAPTFAGFAECTLANGADNRMDCSPAPAPGDPARMLGDTVSEASSFTIGPNISVAGSPPSSMVILQLQGNSGPDNNLICDGMETEDVVLGPIFLDDYPPGFNPLSAAGFNTFTPPLPQLAGPPPSPGGDPVALPDDGIIFRVRPPGGSLVTLQLEPATVMPDRRYLLSIESDDNTTEVKRLALGLTAPTPESAVGMTFEGCNSPGIANFPPGFSGSPNSCPDPDPDPSELGTNVNVPTTFLNLGGTLTPVVATYTIDPDAGDAPGTGRVPNTLYVGLQAQNQSLNNTGIGNRTTLGVVSFPEPTPTPQITFEGVELAMPGFLAADGGALQPPGGGALPEEQVTLTKTFSADEDSDNDTVPDDLDNCLLAMNTAQENFGGVRFVGQNIDQIGNICTCGDPGGDGIVDNGDATGEEELPEQNDVEICQELLGLPPGQPAAGTPEAEQAERCKVLAGNATFGIIDAVVLDLETQGMDSGVGDTFSGALQSCSAADAPQSQ